MTTKTVFFMSEGLINNAIIMAEIIAPLGKYQFLLCHLMKMASIMPATITATSTCCIAEKPIVIALFMVRIESAIMIKIL